MNVVLLGHGINLKQVKSALIEGTVNVVGETSSLVKLKEIISNRNDISVVCCLLGFRERQSFKEALFYCHENNISFLHPAFVLNRYNSTDSPRIRMYGFIGSGNVLLGNFITTHLQSTFKRIVRRGYRFLPLRDNIHDRIARHYVNTFKYFANEAFKTDNNTLQGATHIYSVSEKHVGSCHVMDTSGNSLYRIFGFPFPVYIWWRFVSDHCMLGDDIIDFYKANNFKQILLVRHPFDTIFSCLKKTNTLHAPDIYSVLQTMAKYYNKYMSKALAYKQHLWIIKYEDVINDSIDTLKKLADYCGLDVTEKQIRAWKEKKLFKLLPAAPNKHHFTGGGKNKWVNYFDAECYHILAKNNIFNLVKELGYDELYQDLTTGNTQANDHDDGTVKLYPGWNNEAYDFFTTPKKNRLFYNLSMTTSRNTNDLQKACMPLMLMTDAFFYE